MNESERSWYEAYKDAFGIAWQSGDYNSDYLANIKSLNSEQGSYHNCVVSNNDNTYCWGSGAGGGLGNGSTSNQSTPVRVLKRLSIYYQQRNFP